MKTTLLAFTVALALLAAGCDGGKRREANAADTTGGSRQLNHDEMERNAAPASLTLGQPVDLGNSIKLVPFQSAEFNDAVLKLDQPANAATLQPGPVPFTFTVQNYELMKQTACSPNCNMANAAKGQHIHYIMDNKPYVALYEPRYSDTLKAGYHVLLAFLSRSFHESIKAPNASIVSVVKVGNPAGSAPDLSKPMLFYSRPKGTYNGPNETQRVLLDFYLKNVTLSPTGYRVRATIDGKSTDITTWQPYFIEGLPVGEHTIKLELLNPEKLVVPGPYGTVERKITLK